MPSMHVCELKIAIAEDQAKRTTESEQSHSNPNHLWK